MNIVRPLSDPNLLRIVFCYWLRWIYLDTSLHLFRLAVPRGSVSTPVVCPEFTTFPMVKIICSLTLTISAGLDNRLPYWKGWPLLPVYPCAMKHIRQFPYALHLKYLNPIVTIIEDLRIEIDTKMWVGDLIGGNGLEIAQTLGTSVKLEKNRTALESLRPLSSRP